MDISILESVISLEGEIVKNRDFLQLTKLLKKQSNNELIYTIMKTQGGSTGEASKMAFNLMEYVVVMDVFDNVHSAGLLVLLGCTYRYAHKDTQFLFHYPDFKEGTEKEKQQQLKKIQNFIIDRAKLSLQHLDYFMLNNVILTAKEARKYGIVDTVYG